MNNLWTMKLQELLEACQESNNPNNRYALAAWRCASPPDSNKVVGHLPNKIFCFTYFIIAHWAVVTVWVIFHEYMKLPLICGARAGGTYWSQCSNGQLWREQASSIAKYTELVSDHYEEAVGENFQVYTSSILAGNGVFRWIWY